jgi:hypothetical protein
MPRMADVTFRDFAGAVMQKDRAAAGKVLEQLLALPPERAAVAAGHFDDRMAKDPAFMMKAMGLRTAVTSGGDEDIRALLGDCFGLEGAEADGAVAELRRRYPKA